MRGFDAPVGDLSDNPYDFDDVDGDGSGGARASSDN